MLAFYHARRSETYLPMYLSLSTAPITGRGQGREGPGLSTMLALTRTLPLTLTRTRRWPRP